MAFTQITASGVAPLAVGNGKLADNAVGTAKLVDLAVTTAKLAQKLTLATAQATTSGTAITFTGIPSWAQRVTVLFDKVSTNGAAIPEVRISAGRQKRHQQADLDHWIVGGRRLPLVQR